MLSIGLLGTAGFLDLGSPSGIPESPRPGSKSYRRPVKMHLGVKLKFELIGRRSGEALTKWKP
jgi:hypothetical protein